MIGAMGLTQRTDFVGNNSWSNIMPFSDLQAGTSSRLRFIELLSTLSRRRRGNLFVSLANFIFLLFRSRWPSDCAILEKFCVYYAFLFMSWRLFSVLSRN